MDAQSVFKLHEQRFCHLLVESRTGNFKWTGVLKEIHEDSLTFEARDGRRKTILADDIREITSEEYQE